MPTVRNKVYDFHSDPRQLQELLLVMHRLVTDMMRVICCDKNVWASGISNSSFVFSGVLIKVLSFLLLFLPNLSLVAGQNGFTSVGSTVSAVKHADYVKPCSSLVYILHSVY